jgi:hypothetical protein
MLIASIAAGTAVSTWLIGRSVLRTMHGRSLRSYVIVYSAMAFLAHMLAAFQAILISPSAGALVLAACLPAEVVTVALAYSLERAISADCQALRPAIRELGREARPTRSDVDISSARPVPPCVKLADVSREVAAARARLARSRELEHALECSTREALVQACRDLYSPVASLQEMAEMLEECLVIDLASHYTSLRLTVERLSSMVENFFELSRLHAGVRKPASERLGQSAATSCSNAGAHGCCPSSPSGPAPSSAVPAEPHCGER